MNIDKELNGKGFCQSKKSNTWYYQYSDFETLSFKVCEHAKVNGEKVLKFSNLKIIDYINRDIHISINYDVYFNTFNDFYEFLRLINYQLYPNS